MWSWKSPMITKGRFILPRILTSTRIPLSTSASTYSANKESNGNRGDGSSNSTPRTSLQLERASPESYQRARRGAFSQPMPQLHNPFIEDPFLRTCLSNMLPPQVSSTIYTYLDLYLKSPWTHASLIQQIQ